jgi:hypothetical protein
MQPHTIGFGIIAAGGLCVALAASAVPAARKGFDAEIDRFAENMLAQGRKIFRFWSEAFWGGQLQLKRPSPTATAP